MSYTIWQSPDESWPAPARCICGGITLPESEQEPHRELLDQNGNPLSNSSPFANRFDTNYAASTEETPHLRSLIDEQKAEIERTTQRIFDLQREIIRLCHENEPRRTFVQKHEAFLAPIRRLPVDLLQEIFAHCISSAMPGSMHEEDPPMVLTRVCSAWREVVLSTPLLWSSIHVSVPPSLPPDAPDPVAPRIDALHEWLNRSGSTPLRVSIYQADTNVPTRDTRVWSEIEIDDRECMRRIMNALRPSIPRFKVLSLTCPVASAQFFFDIPSSEWVSIQDVLFFNRTPEFETLPTESNQGQLSLPGRGPFYASNLSMVTLNGVPYAHDPLAYSIPWYRITSLCLSGGAPQAGPMSYLNLFAQIASTIESLDLDIHPTHGPSFEFDSWSGTGLPIDAQKIITLPHLKRFALRERYSPFTLLPKSIRCPVLEHLKYEEVPVLGFYSPILHGDPAQVMQDTSPHGQQTPTGSLITLLSHSGSLIKAIGFNHTLYTNEDLITIFSFLPCVEYIYQFGHTRGSFPSTWPNPSTPITPKDVFNVFVTPQDSPFSNGLPYCPLLTSLTWGRPNASDSEFLEFLKLKQSGTLDGVAKLDAVSIHFDVLSEESRQKIFALFPNLPESRVSITHNPSDTPRRAYGSGIRDGLYGQMSRWPVKFTTGSSF